MILEALLIITLVILIICVLMFDREIKRYRKEISEYKAELNVRDTEIANLKSELKNMLAIYQKYIFHVNDIAKKAKFYLEDLEDGQCAVIATTAYLGSPIKIFNLGDPELNTIYAEELLEKLNDND